MRTLRVMFYCTSEHEKAQAERVLARLGDSVEPVMAGVPFGPSATAVAGVVRSSKPVVPWEWRLVARAKAVSRALPLPLQVMTALPFLVTAAVVSLTRYLVLGPGADSPTRSSLIAYVFCRGRAREIAEFLRAHRMGRSLLEFLRLVRSALKVPDVRASLRRRIALRRHIALRHRIVRRRVLTLAAPFGGKWAARRCYYVLRDMHRGYRERRPGWLAFVARRKHMRDLKRRFAGLLRDQELDALVLFEDNVGGLTRIIAGAAVEQRLAYFILPVTIPNPKEPAAFYRAQPSHMISGMLARFVAARWPKWCYEHEGVAMLRLPAPEVLSMRVLGLDPPQPWILNSGNAEAICIESEAMLRHYRSLGFPERQLVITGSLVDDTLHAVYRERQARRETLLAGFGLDPGRPLFVVGFPPDQYTSPDISLFEFARFEELIDGWRAALASALPHANVIIKPHPRLSNWRLSSLKAAGMPVITDPTEELVPLADVYIASISATIRWALALGIPVVNYDCYRYRYGDFDAAAGLITIEHVQDFKAAVAALANDPARRAATAYRQSGDARHWGLIDGRFSERLLQLFSDRLHARADRPAAALLDDEEVAPPRPSTSPIKERIAEDQPSA